MDFPEFYKELEAEIYGAGAKLMGLQFLQLELRLRKNPSRSFRPVKSAKILWSILEKEKLNGSDFLDWYRNLRIVLRNKQKLHHLEEALPEAPPATATVAVRNAYTRRVAKQQEVACLMLQQAEQELFETVKAFHACKQKEGQSVSTYVLKMKAYLDQMERLGYPMHLVLGVNLILTSLSKDYDQFVQNYNMHGMRKTIPELHAMLKLAEKSIPKKDPAVLAIKQGQIQKPKSQARGKGKQRGKGKSELAYDSKNKIHPPAKRSILLRTLSGLIGYRKLNKRALDLYVGNGHSAAVEAIGSFELILPSGMILDSIFYFNAFPSDGIFEIDMHNHISNERSIYTCSNKKTKHNLDYTFLWHCRLGHINKKRIAKLQHDGLLASIDDESFDVCVSCISGKMARKPFTFASERADDLLGIIHSDVCRPFRTTSREGEHLSQEFLDHLWSHGIISQLTPPYTPQHNGVSERRNQTLLDMVRSMMSLTTLPMSFWGYALESAARILNMVPTKKVNKTPYEMCHGKVPNLSYLKEIMGYYFYYPLENKIFVARYAEFFETNLKKQEASGSTIDFDEIQREDAQPSENTSQHQHEVKHDTIEPQTDLGDHGEPPNYRVALSDPKSKKWLKAMNAEMQSMKTTSLELS
ncbi:retrotransposon protein, putative, ty1-copia subclass [Tanacetum coccineum]